ncbi:MAG TPA: hypothetical protein VF507_10335, partial [Pyrinomonadaceae bacterium]
TGSPEKIKRITDAAGRAGVVIYTVDARGLFNSAINVAANSAIDGNGSLSRAEIGETVASQDGMNALARDTGGRPLRNTNLPLNEWVERVLTETSAYYLLAWRPDTEEQKNGKFKNIEVSIAGRPDLHVRLRRGYFNSKPIPLLTASKKKKETDPEKAREAEMRELIDSPLPRREVPTKLAVSYVNTPLYGMLLTASMKIGREALAFEPYQGKMAAEVEVGGILYDEKGKSVDSVGGRLRIFQPPQDAPNTQRLDAIYNYRSQPPPGLYQVRMAVRDLKTGRMGSAVKWVEIPNLSSRKLTLSSLLVEEASAGQEAFKAASSAIERMQVSPDLRLPRGARLRYLLFIYNATHAPAVAPNVTVQTQILRDKQPALNVPEQKLKAEAKDADNLPYGGEIPLKSLAPGRYTLRVTVTDRATQATATQQVRFEIE